MKLLRIIGYSVLAFLVIQGRAQTLQIGSVQSCTGDTASVPITMSSLNNVGSVTLFIEYDTSLVNFVTLTNINPVATGILFNDMHAWAGGPRLGIIAISWIASTAGTNFSAGIFAVLKFEVLGGYCPIILLNNCEIADYNAQIISVNYIDGSLISWILPDIITQPAPLSLNTTQYGFFTVNATNVDSIRWQINHGIGWVDIQNNNVFQGYNKDTLFICQPNQGLDGAYFRCILSNLCFSVQSDSAILNITASSVLSDKTKLYFNIYPNPFSNYVSIDFSQPTFVEEINIFQIEGKFIKRISGNENIAHLEITHLDELEKGIYYFEIISKDINTEDIINTIQVLKN